MKVSTNKWVCPVSMCVCVWGGGLARDGTCCTYCVLKAFISMNHYTQTCFSSTVKRKKELKAAFNYYIMG